MPKGTKRQRCKRLWYVSLANSTFLLVSLSVCCHVQEHGGDMVAWSHGATLAQSNLVKLGAMLARSAFFKLSNDSPINTSHHALCQSLSRLSFLNPLCKMSWLKNAPV